MKKITLMLTVLLATVGAQAEEAAAAAVSTGNHGMLAIGAAIAIAVAVLGGAIGQAIAASAALEGISRNPSATDKIFTPMILSLALIESLVILAFLIAFLVIPGMK
jgi:F-type H+-transporting ATPase subunit c